MLLLPFLYEKKISPATIRGVFLSTSGLAQSKLIFAPIKFNMPQFLFYQIPCLSSNFYWERNKIKSLYTARNVRAWYEEGEKRTSQILQLYWKKHWKSSLDIFFLLKIRTLSMHETIMNKGTRKKVSFDGPSWPWM